MEVNKVSRGKLYHTVRLKQLFCQKKNTIFTARRYASAVYVVVVVVVVCVCVCVCGVKLK